MRKVKNINEVIRFIKESESNVVYIPGWEIKEGFCYNKNDGIFFVSNEGCIQISGWVDVALDNFPEYDVDFVEKLKGLIQLEDDPQEEIERLKKDVDFVEKLNENLQNDLARSYKEIKELTIKVEEYDKPVITTDSSKQGCTQPYQSQEEFYKDIINFLIKGK